MPQLRKRTAQDQHTRHLRMYEEAIRLDQKELDGYRIYDWRALDPEKLYLRRRKSYYKYMRRIIKELVELREYKNMHK